MTKRRWEDGERLMIQVSEAELPHALTHLDKHSEGPIFLQSNLRNYGLASEASNSVYLWRNADCSAFIGVTVAGVMVPQMRDASDGDWKGLRAALAGVQIGGIIGEYGQATRSQDELGFTNIPKSLDDNEPAFDLALADLRIPEHDGLSATPPRGEDEEILLDWRIAYRIEILGDDPATAKGTAIGEVKEILRNKSHWLLWQGKTPVSMAGINSHIPDVVQIGGVYTPPDLRGRGYARCAVALLLEQKRREGFSRAFLFAASEQAARAYTVLGFEPNGRVRMIFYRDKITIPHDPPRG